METTQGSEVVAAPATPAAADGPRWPPGSTWEIVDFFDRKKGMRLLCDYDQRSVCLRAVQVHQRESRERAERDPRPIAEQLAAQPAPEGEQRPDPTPIQSDGGTEQPAPEPWDVEAVIAAIAEERRRDGLLCDGLTCTATGVYATYRRAISRFSPVAEVAELREERDKACQLVAKMHEAAMGKVCGPRKGPAEDVAELRKEVERLREERSDSLSRWHNIAESEVAELRRERDESDRALTELRQQLAEAKQCVGYQSAVEWRNKFREAQRQLAERPDTPALVPLDVGAAVRICSDLAEAGWKFARNDSNVVCETPRQIILSALARYGVPDESERYTDLLRRFVDVRAERNALLARLAEAREALGGANGKSGFEAAVVWRDKARRLDDLIDATAKVWLAGNVGIPWEGAIDAAMQAAVDEIKRLRSKPDTLDDLRAAMAEYNEATGGCAEVVILDDGSGLMGWDVDWGELHTAAGLIRAAATKESEVK